MSRLQRYISALWTGTAVLFLGASICTAQVQTTSTTSQGTSTQTTTVEKGQVVYVSGNSLVVKMADGTLRHFNNVPDSVTATVDGQQLNIHQLKPGMTLQRTLTTTTTPETIKTVQTVTGTVWYINPPNTVILTLANGKNQEFKIPNGQKFNVDGQLTDAWGLKKGMKISASKVVQAPSDVVTQQAKLTGKMPPAPPPPPADAPILVVEEEAPAPVETAQAAPAPAALPKTGSPLPLIGLLGLFSLATSLGLRALRVR